MAAGSRCRHGGRRHAQPPSLGWSHPSRPCRSPGPRWGAPGVDSDPCPTPPGPTADGCVVSGRLSRLTASGNQMSGPEQVLIEDWCQQYPSHSVGALEFGADGALYATGGDGASFNFADWGQDGAPLNPCGDPPGGVGATLTPPTAEGGALRSQDLRTAGDPVTLDGAVIRVDPATGAALPTNPLAANPDQNAKRIIAYGLRNPFRFTFRPGTNELWLGDVGWGTWEEINRIPSTTDGIVENFGWPCYEGAGRQSGYDGANLGICETLYGQAGAVTAPYHAYHHSNRVVEGETCPTGSSSIAGMQFEFSAAANTYPAEYDGALFFADYSRDCIWMMPKGADSRPVPGQVRTFVAGAANPVNLETGPGGDLFYVDFDGGTIRRIQYFSTNQPPTAVAQATPTTGAAPLTVSFNGTGSSDPDPGDTLAYAWDLDGDGAFDDASTAQATYTYTAQGTYAATLRVTDSHGASDTDTVPIAVGNTPPTPTIATPAAGTTWKVGDVISFSGSATDQQDGTIPASGALLEADPAALPDQLPPARGPNLLRCGQWVVHRAGPRVPVISGADPDRDRLGRPDRHQDPAARPPHRGPQLPDHPGRPQAGRQRDPQHGDVHPHGHRGVHQHGQRGHPATQGRQELHLRVLVGRGAQTHTIVAPATAATYTARFRAR
jgi:glucose/arabinose dehydrogenase